MASASSVASIEKLKGRENYATWQFAITNFLELMDLGKTILGTETDVAKVAKAKAYIILSIEPINFIHVQTATTAKEVWENLQKVFEDSGLTRKIGLIRTLVTTQLVECASIEDYVNKIITTVHKLSAIGYKIDDEWTGTFLLAGLPEQYDTMIMGIESSGVKITGDSIKTKLLQDIKSSTSVESAFFNKAAKSKSKKFHRNSKSVRCYSCNELGHMANKCPNKKNENIKPSQSKNETPKNGGFSAVFLSGDFSKNDWYIDSGASMHMTSNKGWLEGISKSNISEIVVANSTKLSVECIGNLKLKINCDNIVSNITVSNVLCVPGLTTNLLSVSQIIKMAILLNLSQTVVLFIIKIKNY